MAIKKHIVKITKGNGAASKGNPVGQSSCGFHRGNGPSKKIDYADRAVKYLKGLKHPKSSLKGSKFQLDEWQEDIVRAIYGPRDEKGRRIVKTVFILVGRGNRKTSLAAALALLHAHGPEASYGGQVMLAASTRDQAKLAYEEIWSVAQSSFDHWESGQMKGSRKRGEAPANLIRKVGTRNVIECPNGSVVKAVSSDETTLHGATPVFALCDELHVWHNRGLWDAIKTGLIKVPGSLLVIITTAGAGRQNIAHEVYEYAKKVASGEIVDPSFLPILFENEPGCDWEDEANWHRANPGLKHGYPDIDGMRQFAREAKHRPSDQMAFKQFNLNVWQEASSAPFVTMQVYDKGNREIDFTALEDVPCYLGVDLSSVDDLTAVVAAWRRGETYFVQPYFFVPEDTLLTRTTATGIPYTLWRDQGHIITTPGPAVDYDYVEDHIRQLCHRFKVKEVAFDPALARRSMNILAAEGLPVVEFRQGWDTMAPAVKTLERAIIGGNFIHRGNPVLRWNFENIQVAIDAAGNQKFSKKTSTDKIDGAVAAVMAVARAEAGEEHSSIYDNPNLDPSLFAW